MLLTCVRLMYRTRPKRDRWWKIQRLKEQARHYWYRSLRARVGLSMIYLRRSYLYQTMSRMVKPYIRRKLRNCRLDAASKELDLPGIRLKSGLRSSGVKVNTHMLTILSMYEPRTFRSLTELAQRAEIEKSHARHVQLPERCFTKVAPK